MCNVYTALRKTFVRYSHVLYSVYVCAKVMYMCTLKLCTLVPVLPGPLNSIRPEGQKNSAKLK